MFVEYVHDKRNPKVSLGPYKVGEGRQLAANLNDFVQRNAGIMSCPFYMDRNAVVVA